MHCKNNNYFSHQPIRPSPTSSVFTFLQFISNKHITFVRFITHVNSFKSWLNFTTIQNIETIKTNKRTDSLFKRKWRHIMVKTEPNAYSSALNISLCNFHTWIVFKDYVRKLLLYRHWKPPDDNYYKLFIKFKCHFCLLAFFLYNSKEKVMV